MVAWLRRERPVVNAQEFCAGREAIVTAACVDGKVQALVCLEVVQVSEARARLPSCESSTTRRWPKPHANSFAGSD